MHRPQPRLLIGVCTRQRNVLLRRLIDSISAQPAPAGYDVGILVVDNNDDPVARDALVGLSGPFPVTVVHEARAGLVYARNRALNEAAARGADWFVGVDDDEWVAQDWLARFIDGMETLGRSILIAPCRYVYDDGLSRFLQPIQLPSKPRGARPVVMASSNFALHCRVFDPAYGPGLRFHPAYNESGGEDLEFFLRAERACGWVPAALPDAVAFEDWKGPRATLGYRLRRSWRTQLAAFQVARHHRRLGFTSSGGGHVMRMFLQLNRHVVFGAASLMAGLALLLFWPRKGRHLIGAGLERGARVLAVLPFLLGRLPVAYGPRASAQ
ncbi:glycosyltransferase family 2 protein [Yoonia sp. R2-816]|uniref:glycosyltransferase family 2 protein n=1 Tax=Yoonia sp. R2-816 TaxID=3342638 RepID=UPI00372973F6